MSTKKIKKPKISKLEKSKLNPNSNYWKNKAYAAWVAVVRKKSGNEEFGKCAVCGECSKPCDTHHLLPRELKRWWLDWKNGIVLCKSHHKYSRELSAHKAPMQFAFWLELNKKEQWEWLKEEFKRDNPKVQINTMKEAYEVLIKELEATPQPLVVQP